MLNENFAGSMDRYELHLNNLKFIEKFVEEDGIEELDTLIDREASDLEAGWIALYEPECGGDQMVYYIVDHTWNSNGCTTTEQNDEVRKEIVRIFYNMAITSGREFELNSRKEI